jgi:hypothetical protein
MLCSVVIIADARVKHKIVERAKKRTQPTPAAPTGSGSHFRISAHIRYISTILDRLSVLIHGLNF